MMNIKLIAFLFTTVLIFSGCYKDNFEFRDGKEIIEETNSGDIGDFFDRVPNDFDSISLDASLDQIIITDNNTVIQFFAGSFLDESGNVVAGNIDFKYIEVLDHADYLFYGLPTISDEKLLRSAGVYRFEAGQDGKQLRLKDSKSISVSLPVDNPEEGMQLFTGVGSGEDFNWESNDALTGADAPLRINEWSFLLDSTNQELVSGFGYVFDCDLFTWINVDIFADVPEDQKTEVCVELPEIYTNKNTIVFMYFNDSNSILGLYGNGEEMKWCESYGATPIGYKVTFIVVSSQGDDLFHFAMQEAEIRMDHLEFIEPEEKSFDDIIDAIKKL